MPDKPERLISLLQQHLSWYPLMEPRDIYKLLFQGMMGPEHLVSSPAEFNLRLRLEFEHLHPDAHERVYEPVRADQSLMRVNLRAYKSRSPLSDPLLTPILETASTFLPDPDQLRIAWMDFVRYCEQGFIDNFKIIDVHQFSRWLAKTGFQAVHHSEVYRREYQPAYRLISSRYIPTMDLHHAG